MHELSKQLSTADGLMDLLRTRGLHLHFESGYVWKTVGLAPLSKLRRAKSKCGTEHCCVLRLKNIERENTEAPVEGSPNVC